MWALGMIICVVLGFLMGFYSCTLMVMKDRKELKRIMETALEKERKTGKWVKGKSSLLYYLVKCSVCGSSSAEIGKYCPHCGAMMKEVDE